MSSRDELILEHRVSELELELHQLKRQLERLSPAQSAPAQSAPAQQAKSYLLPAERTIIHQKRTYDFFAKLPEARIVVDYFSRNTNTNEVEHIGFFSPAQIIYACRKFADLQFPTRRLWKGNTRLYSVARRLFAQHGEIQQHKGSRVWHWVNSPGARLAACARIAASLSRKS